MLLFVLLESGVLKPERGDVVVFNNTSAEHPATYEFVRSCKERCEGEYGIPFFWTEFLTYEDAAKGIYNRLPAYRLVNEMPYSHDNPNGYRCAGEVFEELVSWSGYLPNQFSGRICTSWMKLFVSKEFLRDWFARKNGIERLGHYGETSRINPDDLYEAHMRNRGSTPKEIYLAKKEYALSMPLSRPAQNYSDFSVVADPGCIKNEELDGKSLGKRVKLTGDAGVEYVSFVGFRGDEPHRLARMRARQAATEEDLDEDGGFADSYLSTPNGEHVYAPLVQMEATKEDVLKYWENKDWNLKLPPEMNLSNCVYCFLKGGNALWHIANKQDSVNRKLPSTLKAKAGTPSEINWWVKLEDKYARDLEAEEREITSKNYKANGKKPVIGFFGFSHKLSYAKIEEMSKEFKARKLHRKKRNILLSEFQSLPCDCTD